MVPLNHLHINFITSYVPDQQTKAKLTLAGLGDKKISIFMHGDAEDIDAELNHHFPKLGQGGGYELLRCSDKGGRELLVIDMPAAGYTPQYLKSVVTSAKIYIRPLQRDLDISPAEDVCVGTVFVSSILDLKIMHTYFIIREQIKILNRNAKLVGVSYR